MNKLSLAIHGGAGTILKEDMTPDLEKAYMNGLDEALAAGFAVLEEGGSAVNAVKASIVVLEDNLFLFNAGRGSVFTKKGVQEMDAAIMDGKDLSAGSVAGIRNVRNPIELATEVMLHSNHVFLSGLKGASSAVAMAGVQSRLPTAWNCRSSSSSAGRSGVRWSACSTPPSETGSRS